MNATTTTELVFASLASAVVVVAAATDLRARTISNRLTLIPLCVAPWLHALVSGTAACLQSVAGALLCALVPLLGFARRGLGGGDVKLFAALGALLGVEAGLRVELLALCFAGVYAALLLAWRGTLLRALARSLHLVVAPAALADSTLTLPLAPAIALATWLVVWLPKGLLP